MSADESDDAPPPPPKPLHPALRAFILPWWHKRAVELAALLEKAVEAGETEVAWKGRRVPLDIMVRLAEEADAMITK